MLPNVLRTNAADHVPVLAEEVRDLLAVQPGETVVDATFGAGGHSRLLAEDLEGRGKLVAIDRDPTVRPYFDRVKAARRGVQTALPARRLRGRALTSSPDNGVKADVVLLDLGLSSMQVDRHERGFSYATDAPLDMRMDPSDEPSAADVVNTWDERELATIFRRYGEERYARQIARGIVRRRAEEPIERTGQLVDVVRASIPAPARFGEGHPAKRVFQALRIEVNHELESLEAGLPAAFEMLRPGGRLAVISFHSLEDRIAKRFLRDLARGCTCPPELPDLRLRPRARAPHPHAEAGAAVGTRGRREPARGVCAAARGGEGLMSSVAQSQRAVAARRRPAARSRGEAAAARRRRALDRALRGAPRRASSRSTSRCCASTSSSTGTGASARS